MKKYRVALIVLAGLFIATRFFQFGTNPAGIHVDEAGMAYDAWNLTQFGTDRYGNPYPVYLINFDAGQSALYAYLAAFFMKFFGLTMTAIRLPAVLSSALLVIAGIGIGKELGNRKLGFMTAVLLVICPYFIMASRWGLDCNLFLGFFSFSLWLLMIAIRKEKWQWFSLSGVLFGITLYTYVMSFMVLPIFLGSVLLYLIWCKRVKISQVVAISIPLAVFAIPLMLMLAVNNGFIGEIKTEYFTIPKLFYYRGAEFSLRNIPDNLKLVKTLLYHDHLDYNASFTYGTLYLISIPLLFIGVGTSLKAVCVKWKEKQFKPEALILIMAGSVLFCSLIVFDGYIINKSNAIFFSLAFFAARGLLWLWESAKLKKLSIVVMAVYMVLFSGFCSEYFGREADHRYLYFEQDLPQVVDYLEKQEEDIPIVYVDGSRMQQPYIFVCLKLRLTPEEFVAFRESGENQYGRYCFTLPETVDETAVYVLPIDSEGAEELREQGFKETQTGKLGIYKK